MQPAYGPVRRLWAPGGGAGARRAGLVALTRQPAPGGRVAGCVAVGSPSEIDQSGTPCGRACWPLSDGSPQCRLGGRWDCGWRQPRGFGTRAGARRVQLELRHSATLGAIRCQRRAGMAECGCAVGDLRSQPGSTCCPVVPRFTTRRYPPAQAFFPWEGGPRPVRCLAGAFFCRALAGRRAVKGRACSLPEGRAAPLTARADAAQAWQSWPGLRPGRLPVAGAGRPASR